MGGGGVDFAGSAFSLPENRRGRFAAALAGRCDPAAPLAVLEIGCGTGGELLELARALPAARFTGVDISRPSIARAREACRREGLAARVELVEGDYMATAGGPWDLVLSDSTFHLMEVSLERLLAKLLGELKPGGLLLFTMPLASPYNRLLVAFRRVLRLCRGRLLDGLILRAGRLLHGDMPVAQLRERIHYMYVVPNKYWSPRLERRLEGEFGLRALAVEFLPQASLAQPRHIMALHRLDPGGGEEGKEEE